MGSRVATRGTHPDVGFLGRWRSEGGGRAVVVGGFEGKRMENKRWSWRDEAAMAMGR